MVLRMKGMKKMMGIEVYGKCYGGWSIGVLIKPGFELVESFATMGDLVFLLFGHLRVCLAFVLER